jgi:hypothetical protein
MTDAPTRARLLAQAARCYRNAGLGADAVRCLELAGDWLGAALMHRDAGRPSRAADCFERAGRHADAADCHLRAGRPDAAARCLELAGDIPGAAWLLAHLAGRPQHADAVLARSPAAPTAQDRPNPDAAGADQNATTLPATTLPIARALVRARIAAHRDHAAAARLLRRATADLAALAPSPGHARPWGWAHTLAEQVLERADLTAELHAAAHRAGLPDGAARWEAWAHGRLGDSTGVPEPPAGPDDPTGPVPDPAPAREHDAQPTTHS